MRQGRDKAISLWSQFIFWLTKTTEIAIIIMTFCLIVIIGVGVVLRYFFGFTIFFSSELARYLLVWIVFLASSLGIRTGAHVGVEIFQKITPPKIKIIMLYISYTLLGFFIMIVGLVSAVYLLPPLWTQVTAAMGVRLFWIFLCVPIGMLLMLLQLIDFIASNK